MAFSIANAITVSGQRVYVVGNRAPASGNREFTTPACGGSVARSDGSSRF
ncbi:hypothetical protein GCM10007907_22840 [Chitinimonas prasina]|uniref:Uncharacterized protein n=1 Tax=Chitinimonas prasina TaxID=1434937 RepID=A0ABQ5YFJ3_9NEIS|nr:hypothetical protein GCM10007907_22840 [Chitinimonas prasina]